MTRREKFLKTVRREMEGYIPFYFHLCPSLEMKFKQKTGRDDYMQYYNFPMRFVGFTVRNATEKYKKYYKNPEGEINIDYWGVGHRKGTFEHFTRMIHPMENFETLEDFMSYPYPDPEKDIDWSGIPASVKALKEDDLIAYSSPGMLGPTLFEIAWYLRGMDNFMVDMMTEPEIVKYHLDRITEIREYGAVKYAEAGVDVIRLGDDVSTQLDMMMSPELYRKYLKPRMKRIIDAARNVNPDVLIDYHGDGNISKVIPDLIEIGVDILNPVQPECVNPVEMKQLYGERLSFNGTVGTQTTMPFGTPEEVDRVCREMIEKVGRGGGLILAPTHILEPEVPWENIEAFLNAIDKYSKIK